jgi:MoxR-like ATPase
MPASTRAILPSSVEATAALLASQNYLADRSLSVVVFLALKLGRPLFLEGEAGVGKTEVAKVLATGLGRELIRLQCHEGLDASSAVYEWNHLRQILELRLAEATETAGSRQALTQEIFDPRFLIKRPRRRAVRGIPSRDSRRLPSHDSGARTGARDRAADRDRDVEPHA